MVIKTVKGNEIKPDSMNMQKLLEELCKEMKHIFLAVMEISACPLGLKQRLNGCKKCKEGGMGENCMYGGMCYGQSPSPEGPPEHSPA